jgi:hypothetical protein
VRRDSDDDDEGGPGQEPIWLYLAVATKPIAPSRTALVYIFESRPSEKRTWALGSELYVPSTPRTMDLVRFTPPTNRPGVDRSCSAARPLPHARSASTVDDLSLFITTRDKAIVIVLADASVHELEAPTASPLDGRIRSGSRASDPMVKRTGPHGGRRQSAIYDGAENTSAESVASYHAPSANAWTSVVELRLPWLDRSMPPAYLITRGPFSYLSPAPLASHRLRPHSTIRWRISPVHVVALVPSSGVRKRHVVLVGFTATGLEVQEGILADDRYQWTAAPADDDRDPTAIFDFGMPTGYLCAGETASPGDGRRLPASCCLWSAGLNEIKMWFLG